MATRAGAGVDADHDNALQLSSNGNANAKHSDRDRSPASSQAKQRTHRSQAWKYLLLGVFCLGVFIDVMGICVFYILLAPVTTALGIAFEQQTWIINSYAVTFSACLLFWGRVSDLYSPKPVFTYGFLALGILNLIISFLTDQYSFFILRAISGIASACLIPASYRLITAVFEEDELSRAFTVYSLCGALGAAFGVPIGGLVELIPDGGQMLGWRWYFRITTVIIIPVSIWSFYHIPREEGEESNIKDKWKHLDIPGSLLMLSAILLLILSLTLGASYGFSTPRFIVPLVISIILFPTFFWYEARLPSDIALIPPATWRYQNFTLWIVLSMYTNAWWTINQIPIIELFVDKYGDLPIIAALRILPSGGFSFLASVIMVTYTSISATPRYSYSIGIAIGMVCYGLFILSQGRTGTDYWRYYFPGISLGTFANGVATTCAIVGAMTACPPSQAGVVGAILQTAVQVGSAIALSIQAGLLTIHPGGINDFRNVAVSFYFMIAWGGLCLLGFWVFYRPLRRVDNTPVAMH